MPIFQVKDLNYYYPDSEKPALKDIELTVEEGEFLLITGGSGSGKSTLARVLAGLVPDFYGGCFGGRVFFKGQDIRHMDRRRLARHVGMVFQDPEKQLVKTEVEAEIAFGLENLGLPRQEMARRVAEVMGFLNLTEVKGQFTEKLSGGQKQKLALASVLAMQPEVLILDEPTSQLDPTAAEDFLNLIKRLNEEMGMTVVLIEHRLERCFYLADRVVMMEDGKLKIKGTPQEVAEKSHFYENPFIPPVARFFARMGFSRIPVTVKEGRKILRANLPTTDEKKESPPLRSVGIKPIKNENLVIVLNNVWFSYQSGKEVLQDVSIQIAPGEFVAILGANGAGKSTLLKIMAGLLKPGKGKVRLLGKDREDNRKMHWDGKIAYLSQNPNDYLFQDTVEQELSFTLKNFKLSDEDRIDDLLERLHLKCYRRANPRDLSSGERQRVALASILVTDPVLLLLDEPTRGMDCGLKAELGKYLTDFCKRQLSVVLVTHDVEFAAEYAKRVVIMYDGRIVCDGPGRQVLGQSLFYSTQMSRMCRGYIPDILTVEEAVKVLAPVLSESRRDVMERGLR